MRLFIEVSKCFIKLDLSSLHSIESENLSPRIECNIDRVSDWIVSTQRSATEGIISCQCPNLLFLLVNSHFENVFQVNFLILINISVGLNITGK